jgi:hypothetical protein
VYNLASDEEECERWKQISGFIENSNLIYFFLGVEMTVVDLRDEERIHAFRRKNACPLVYTPKASIESRDKLI